MLVKSEFEKLGLQYMLVGLGKVEIMEDISLKPLNIQNIDLKKSGLEPMENKKSVLFEQII